MRDFAHQIVFRLFVLFLGVLQMVCSQDARTDFDAKYAKRRGFGCRKAKGVKSLTYFAPETAILGPFFDGT